MNIKDLNETFRTKRVYEIKSIEHDYYDMFGELGFKEFFEDVL